MCEDIVICADINRSLIFRAGFNRSLMLVFMSVFLDTGFKRSLDSHIVCVAVLRCSPDVSCAFSLKVVSALPCSILAGPESVSPDPAQLC